VAIVRHLSESYNFSLQNLCDILTDEFQEDVEYIHSYVFPCFPSNFTTVEGIKEIYLEKKIYF